VLIGLEGGHDRVEMELVRHRHDHHVARWHLGQHFAEQLRVRRVQIAGQIRIGPEGLPGEGALEHWSFGQIFQEAAFKSANGDFANYALALHVIKRGQDLIVGDHPAADNGALR